MALADHPDQGRHVTVLIKLICCFLHLTVAVEAFCGALAMVTRPTGGASHGGAMTILKYRTSDIDLRSFLCLAGEEFCGALATAMRPMAVL